MQIDTHTYIYIYNMYDHVSTYMYGYMDIHIQIQICGEWTYACIDQPIYECTDI